jgi:hypothetical protein
MLCGLTVRGQRSLDHFSAVDIDDMEADTAAADDECGKITPQEPEPFAIASFSAHMTSRVYPTEEQVRDSSCLHIAATLRTSIFDIVSISEAGERYIVDEALARFLSEQQPRLPDLTDVIRTHGMHAQSQWARAEARVCPPLPEAHTYHQRGCGTLRIGAASSHAEFD